MKKTILALLILLASEARAQDKKISELPSGSPAQPADMIPIARGGANFRLAGSDFCGASGCGMFSSGTANTANATLGAELASNPSFTGNITGWSGTNWAYEASNKARHTAGSTSPLTQSVTLVSGTRYLISITQTGRTAGSYTTSVGSQTLLLDAYWDEDQVLVSTQTGSVALNVTPTSDFDGALTKVSIKPFATLVPLSFYIKPSSAEANDYGANFRYSGGSATPYGFGFGYRSLINGLSGGGSNLAFGDRALENVTTGYWNHAFGYQALLNTTTGLQNSAFGKWAMANNTAGSFNVGYGDESLANLRNGSGNVSVGWRSLISLVNANSNTAIGVQAGRGMTTGYQNVCVGGDACWSPAGLSDNALTTGITNTYVGANTGQASATQRSNSAAFGYLATVDASNFITIGNASVTVVAFGGSGGAATAKAKFVELTGVLFAALGTPSNGTITYCSNCTKATPCGSGGTGALAKRLNGAWDCD